MFIFLFIEIFLSSSSSALNVKVLAGAFNQEKALVQAFSVIVKTDREADGSFYSTNSHSSCDCQSVVSAIVSDLLAQWWRPRHGEECPHHHHAAGGRQAVHSIDIYIYKLSIIIYVSGTTRPRCWCSGPGSATTTRPSPAPPATSRTGRAARSEDLVLFQIE